MLYAITIFLIAIPLEVYLGLGLREVLNSQNATTEGLLWGGAAAILLFAHLARASLILGSKIAIKRPEKKDKRLFYNIGASCLVAAGAVSIWMHLSYLHYHGPNSESGLVFMGWILALPLYGLGTFLVETTNVGATRQTSLQSLYMPIKNTIQSRFGLSAASLKTFIRKFKNRLPFVNSLRWTSQEFYGTSILFLAALKMTLLILYSIVIGIVGLLSFGTLFSLAIYGLLIHRGRKVLRLEITIKAPKTTFHQCLFYLGMALLLWSLIQGVSGVLLWLASYFLGGHSILPIVFALSSITFFAGVVFVEVSKADITEIDSAQATILDTTTTVIEDFPNTTQFESNSQNPVEPDDVNNSIDKFLTDQRRRRANKKWWQFWL